MKQLVLVDIRHLSDLGKRVHTGVQIVSLDVWLQALDQRPVSRVDPSEAFPGLTTKVDSVAEYGKPVAAAP
jgi:hypothetical protein